MCCHKAVKEIQEALKTWTSTIQMPTFCTGIECSRSPWHFWIFRGLHMSVVRSDTPWRSLLKNMLLELLLQSQNCSKLISCHHCLRSTNTFATRTISRYTFATWTISKSLFAITITTCNSCLILLVHLCLQFSSASEMTAAATEMHRFVRMKGKVYNVILFYPWQGMFQSKF